jgi:hypothetical protein
MTDFLLLLIKPARVIFTQATKSFLHRKVSNDKMDFHHMQYQREHRSWLTRQTGVRR